MQALMWSDGQFERTDELAEVKLWHAAGKQMWVSVHSRTPATEELLADVFQLHPLVVEDIWLDRSVPKIEDFDGYIYLVVHGVREESNPRKVDLYVLDIVVGLNFVITQSAHATASFERLVADLKGHMVKGTPWLVHSILDRVMDRYLPLMDQLAAQSDELEIMVMRNNARRDADTLLPDLHELRRSIQKMCRMTAYQRDILSRLAHGDYDEIPKDLIPYFRDVYDHFVRVSDQVETYREVINTTMDAYLSLQGNRMNATMMTLTTMSTLMLPLSFIASFYGMNFGYMPELEWRWGYPYVIALMAVVAISVVAWFKHRKWW